MAYQVQAKPSKIQGRLFHHGLIKLIVLEQLQRKGQTWEHFLFWNEFESETQPKEKKRTTAKKASTFGSGKRKRKAISPVKADEPTSSSKPKKARKKLDFGQATEGETSSSKQNVLNLPYSDSEDEVEPVRTEITEQVPDSKQEIHKETPETSKYNKTTTRKIEKFKAEVRNSFEKLAKDHVKLEKKNKKLLQDNEKLHKTVKDLQYKLRIKKPKPVIQPSIEELAQAAESLAEQS